MTHSFPTRRASDLAGERRLDLGDVRGRDARGPGAAVADIGNAPVGGVGDGVSDDFGHGRHWLDMVFEADYAKSGSAIKGIWAAAGFFRPAEPTRSPVCRRSS